MEQWAVSRISTVEIISQVEAEMARVGRVVEAEVGGDAELFALGRRRWPRYLRVELGERQGAVHLRVGFRSFVSSGSSQVGHKARRFRSFCQSQ